MVVIQLVIRPSQLEATWGPLRARLPLEAPNLRSYGGSAVGDITAAGSYVTAPRGLTSMAAGRARSGAPRGVPSLFLYGNIWPHSGWRPPPPLARTGGAISWGRRFRGPSQWQAVKGDPAPFGVPPDLCQASAGRRGSRRPICSVLNGFDP